MTEPILKRVRHGMSFL